MSRAARSSPGGGAAVPLVLVPALLAAALYGGELFLRGAAWIVGGPYSATSATARMDELTAEMDVLRATSPADTLGEIMSPYFAWELPETQDELSAQTAYFATDGAEQAYDVLLLGGRNALELGRERFGEIARELEAHPRFAGRQVRCTVLARDRGKQPQQLNLVCYVLALGWRPDAVVDLDGLAEVAGGFANAERGAHPLQPDISVWERLDVSSGSDRTSMRPLIEARALQLEALDVVAWARRWGLDRSALFGHLTLRRLDRLRTRGASALTSFVTAANAQPRIGVTGPPLDTSDASLDEAIASSWFHASLSLYAVCTARSIPYVHVLEPEPVEEWTPAIGSGYEMLRLRGDQLRTRGVNFVDASKTPPAELGALVARALVDGQG